ncbi:hypothetical protein BIW11_04295, partial [Tropilaelaps mercedesae]
MLLRPNNNSISVADSPPSPGGYLNRGSGAGKKSPKSSRQLRGAWSARSRCERLKKSSFNAGCCEPRTSARLSAPPHTMQTR